MQRKGHTLLFHCITERTKPKVECCDSTYGLWITGALRGFDHKYWRISKKSVVGCVPNANKYSIIALAASHSIDATHVGVDRQPREVWPRIGGSRCNCVHHSIALVLASFFRFSCVLSPTSCRFKSADDSKTAGALSDLFLTVKWCCSHHSTSCRPCPWATG